MGYILLATYVLGIYIVEDLQAGGIILITASALRFGYGLAKGDY